MNIARVIVCVGAVSLLPGCSFGPLARKDAQKATAPAEPAPVVTATPVPVAVAPGTAAPPPALPNPPTAAIAAPAPPPPPPMLDLPNVIYFDTDAYTIRAEYRLLLELHATNLKADPARRLVVQAHADPRGPADYNLALAEKRAQTVIKLLTSLGVDASQVVSQPQGEQPPGNPKDLAKSRRVDLIYRR